MGPYIIVIIECIFYYYSAITEIAENFDTDPFLMLLLRGKDKQEIMSEIRTLQDRG